MYRRILSVGFVLAFILAVAACDPPETDPDPGGDQAQAQEASEDGPSDIDDGGITEISDDPELVEKGEELFGSQGCAGCHQMDSDSAGPALGDVAQRRTAPWLAKMIMHPEEMVDRDPEAQAVSEEFAAPMIPTDLTPEQTKALIAFLGAQ